MKYEQFLFTSTGKRLFILSEDSILITGRKCLKVTLLLRGLEPEYRTVRRRDPVLYIGLISLVLGLVGLAVWPFQSFIGISDLMIFFGISDPESSGLSFQSFVWNLFAALFSVFGLMISLFSWRELEFAVFENTTGIDAISIARAGPDSSSFDQFVDEVAQRIRQAKYEEGEA